MLPFTFRHNVQTQSFLITLYVYFTLTRRVLLNLDIDFNLTSLLCVNKKKSIHKINPRTMITFS